ncbi:MAG: hypothetical protein WC734_05915 [Patescibacteria group bacterium]
MLGKSNSTLSTFTTTNQRISYDTGKIMERSVNRAMQSYRFTEKGNFQYEYQFLTEADYRTLIYMLNDRNSLRDGLFLLPIPYSDNSATAIYTPLYNTHNVYTISDDATAPWGMALSAITKVQADNTNTAKLATYDTDYLNVAASSLYYSGFIFQFNINAFVAAFSQNEIRRLTLQINGMNSSPVRLFCWNVSRSTWYLMDDFRYFDDSQFTDGSFYLYKQIVGQLGPTYGEVSVGDSYLDGNDIVTFMLVGNELNQQVMAQYVRLFVNGFWVDPEEPMDIENYMVSFTGAGRQGTLNLSEV